MRSLPLDRRERRMRKRVAHRRHAPARRRSPDPRGGPRARPLRDAGHATTLVSGGMPTSVASRRPTSTFVQLPPVRSAGTDFSHAARRRNDRPVTTAFSQARRRALIAALRRARPRHPDHRAVPVRPPRPRGRIHGAAARAHADAAATADPVVDPRHSRGAGKTGADRADA